MVARRNRKPRWRRELGYAGQALVLFPLYGVLRLLPVDAASSFGGWLGKTVGPRLGASRKARRNLARALPELPPGCHEAILAGMWENLGRTAAEYSQLDRIWSPDRIEMVDRGNITRLARDGGPAILFSGHLANWEILPLAGSKAGLPLTLIYRMPNNRWVRAFLMMVRRMTDGSLVPKGREGARQIFRTLRHGGHVGMLVDQKLNTGIPVPFFGRDAMTAPALAEFALHFDCPVIPVRIERLHGARFRLTTFPPLTVTRTDDRSADIRRIMVEVNALLEAWIRERPDQWLWLHRRWPD